MKFGALLRKIRKNANITQEQMGFELSLSRPNISKIERDLVELKASDLIKWCQVSQVPEAAVALLCGVDVATVTQVISSLSTLIGGLVLWF